MRPLAITVITGVGADKLIIEIDKPEGCWPYNGNATVHMHVAASSGEDYCQENFPGVKLKIIEV